MKYKKSQYDQAVQFRKRGFTYAEIAKIVDVSKGTVSNWLRDETFSKKVRVQNSERAARENAKRISLLNKARSAERKRGLEAALKSAETEYKHYKKDPLFVAGLMLYVGEGDMSADRAIRLSSSRLDTHRVFIKFAMEYLGVPKDKVRFWLLLYSAHNEKTCMKKWMKVTGITIPQFYKNQYIKGKSTRTSLQYGVGNTVIGSILHKKRLIKWTELLLKEL